jgi:hypothetical protein
MSADAAKTAHGQMARRIASYFIYKAIGEIPADFQAYL